MGKSILFLKEVKAMIEFSHLNEKERLTALTREVQETILGILQILNTEQTETSTKMMEVTMSQKIIQGG